MSQPDPIPYKVSEKGFNNKLSYTSSNESFTLHTPHKYYTGTNKTHI